MSIHYFPQYPVIQTKDLKPRSQMQLPADDDLDPLLRAELVNLRKSMGPTYTYAVTDTPQNRSAMTIRTMLLQQYAYVEGWKFEPNRYQVMYVPKSNTDLPQDNIERRIHELKDSTLNGYEATPNGKYYNRIGNQDFVESLSLKVKNLLKKLGTRWEP